MSLLSQHLSPLDETWVSLDLETTGLSADHDEVIEVGAVKFNGQRVLDTYQTLVNPYRHLPEFVRRYTGITQREVDQAAPFAVVAGQVASFIGDAPVVGHNVGFDLGFLEKKGLKLSNSRCDTWDLAYVVLPEAPEYALAPLAASLGISHPRPHRALPDASVTREVFLKLVEMVGKWDPGLLAEIRRLAFRSQWVLAYLLQGLEVERERRLRQEMPEAGPLGLDMDGLSKRLSPLHALPSRQGGNGVEEEYLELLLAEGGPLSRSVPGYEHRPEQVEMMKAVARAINQRHHLIVEGGTGIGKSLAYLLPAILYALKNDRRVVVSTNTINLQEQLITKDIPALVQALKGSEGLSTRELSATQLKGRANYICLRRWAHLRALDNLSPEEARLLAKTLVWLQTTSTGDRGELNLALRTGSQWDKVSAQGTPDCPRLHGPCFLRAARERATASHLVVVNHALLLSDLALGGGLIPEYDTLIVDEAHHLEEEATRHLGFEVTQGDLEEHIQALSGQRGLLQEAVDAFRGSSVAPARRETVERLVPQAAATVARAKENLERMCSALASFVSRQGEGSREGDGSMRLTLSLRKQPGWSHIEIEWENADLALSEVGRGLQDIHSSLEGLEDAGLINYDGLMAELSHQLLTNSEIRRLLLEFIPHPQTERIYWISRTGQSGDLIMRAAPLQVSDQLEDLLFSQKGCVVLTSATLATNGNFHHMRERTGFPEGQELLLGSPFDYPKAALLCIPQDMPEPTSWAYQAALEQAIVSLAHAAGGRTMVLFTSHASLQTTRSAILGSLEAEGIQVLGQGVDGTPRQLLRNFLGNPRSVLLGTSSFWEGVDLAGEALKVLVLARLPFNVPTEPVFAARSELFDDPFNQYAVPQAALRFRQGFGRLIRTKSDKGAVVILDRRVTSKPYGAAFIKSLPRCAIKKCTLREMPGEVATWLES